MTPDDVAGIIGQKRFWKARKAIFNQQRIFAVQVFELHRLIKVQKLIAASPQLLIDESSYSCRLTKEPFEPKLPINPAKTYPTAAKQKGNHDKPSQKKEISTENTIGKPPISSFQNSAPPPPPPTLNSPASANPSARPWCFNQPQGHQWLVPVMSPSEGLVYKPYPGPSLPSPNPLTGSFLAPAYGIPAPPPAFPQPGPHGYFPTYGMPIMNSAAISASSVEQPNPPPLAQHQKNQASPDDVISLYVSKHDEVKASTASSRVERLQDSRGKDDDVEITNELPLFPVAPVAQPSKSSPNRPWPERPTQVIKVVPHNARTATESAARIFRSIQEERKL